MGKKVIQSVDDDLRQYGSIPINDVVGLTTRVTAAETYLVESASKTDGYISVIASKYGAVGDAHYRTTSNNYFSDSANTIPAKTTGNASAFNQAFTDALAQGKNLLIPYGDFFIDAPITWDFNSGKVNIICMGRLKAKTNIGTMITIKNPRDSKINLDLYDGGVDADIGVLVQGGKFNTFGIRGDYFAGTLWKVTGDSTNVLAANTVDYILSNFCGRAIIHGDGTNAIDGFGAYKSVWDNGSNHGSIFQDASDITLLHYENWFSKPAESFSLSFNTCGAVHIGILAIGGRCVNLLSANGSVISVQKMYLKGEDLVQGQPSMTTNGMLLTNTTLNISTLMPAQLHKIMDYDANSKADILFLDSSQGIDIPISKSGVDSGFAVGRKGSFATDARYELTATEKYSTTTFASWFKIADSANVNNNYAKFQQIGSTFYITVKDSVGNEFNALRYFARGSQTNRWTLNDGTTLKPSNDGATPFTVAASGSPYTYTNSNTYDKQIIIAGGTVSKIEHVRGSTWTDIGVTAGAIRLAPSDGVKITYTVAPTITVIPM